MMSGVVGQGPYKPVILITVPKMERWVINQEHLTSMAAEQQANDMIAHLEQDLRSSLLKDGWVKEYPK
jgi:hypothetical protein